MFAGKIVLHFKMQFSPKFGHIFLKPTRYQPETNTSNTLFQCITC